MDIIINLYNCILNNLSPPTISLTDVSVCFRRYMNYFSLHGLPSEFRLKKRGDRWAKVEQNQLQFSYYTPWVTAAQLKVFRQVSEQARQAARLKAEELQAKDDAAAALDDQLDLMLESAQREKIEQGQLSTVSNASSVSLPPLIGNLLWKASTTSMISHSNTLTASGGNSNINTARMGSPTARRETGTLNTSRGDYKYL